MLKFEPIRSSASGNRIGRADVAPLYRSCAYANEHFRSLTSGNDVEIDPRIIGTVMKFANDLDGYVGGFGPVILCALEHNPAAICDPDNRAMAVEHVNKFMRAADSLLAGDVAPDRRRHPMTDGAIKSLRDQVDYALLKQIRAGRLIKSDFGWFAAPGVVKTFARATPERDACAAKK